MPTLRLQFYNNKGKWSLAKMSNIWCSIANLKQQCTQMADAFLETIMLETTMHPNGRSQMVNVNNAPKWHTLNGACK